MGTDVRALVQRFEPLLHMHVDERFFPSDAKRYIEASEVWPAIGDISVNRGVQRTLKDNWGSASGTSRVPMIGHHMLAAEAGEPGVFLNPAGPFLSDGPLEERFLNLAGWRGGDFVDGSSENGYADLDRIATLYNEDAAGGGDPGLRASRFWYHAEFVPADRLRALLGAGHGSNELLTLFASKTTDPALLTYSFFFPGHDEGLSECGGNPARSWASCAGAWQCLAILLDRADANEDYAPRFAGLTNRLFRAAGFVGLDPRVGMTGNVAPWGSFGTVGDHPMIFVAKGTHGLYFADADQSFVMSAPDDTSVQNCGVYEGLAGFASDNDQSPDPDVAKILIVKIVAGAAAFGFIGAVVGLVAGIEEGLAAEPDLHTATGAPAIDELPKGQFGRILRPPHVDSPLAPAAPGPVWPRFTDDPADSLTTVINGRRYSLIVGTKADPLGTTDRPVWLPSHDGASGFRGRWGNRVTQDPFSRRVGMVYPDFASMFLRAWAVSLSS
jgi:hypothetical protein